MTTGRKGERHRKIAVTVAALGGGLLLAFVGYVALSIYSEMPKVRNVSGPLRLESAWTEFRPKPSLRSTSVHQTVALDFVTQGIGADLYSGALRFPGGEVVRVDIEVRDEQGAAFRLVPVYQTGSEVGFSVAEDQLPTMRPIEYELPHGRYPVLRLRSDRPVDVRSVDWKCWGLK